MGDGWVWGKAFVYSEVMGKRKYETKCDKDKRSYNENDRENRRSSEARQLSSIFEGGWVWGKAFVESGNVRSKTRR